MYQSIITEVDDSVGILTLNKAERHNAFDELLVDEVTSGLLELEADPQVRVVVLDADLAAATKTGVFKKAYPDRHFDCGIAESNMMATAAGMAAMGLVPFASSFAMFAAGRAFEQVRNSIGYPHLNVKIGATHGGISVGEDGASHQCCEDFALMRSLPGMTIICPADDVEARAAVRAAYEMQCPVYLRFGRLAVPVFHDEANYHFELGKGEQLTEGNDIAIVATGLLATIAYGYRMWWTRRPTTPPTSAACALSPEVTMSSHRSRPAPSPGRPGSHAQQQTYRFVPCP